MKPAPCDEAGFIFRNAWKAKRPETAFRNLRTRFSKFRYRWGVPEGSGGVSTCGVRMGGGVYGWCSMDGTGGMIGGMGA